MQKYMFAKKKRRVLTVCYLEMGLSINNIVNNLRKLIRIQTFLAFSMFK